MVTALDDQIGRLIAALDQKGMRDDTLIVFQSDNGGTSNPMFAGEGDVSKIKIPVDNGPYRDGKGSLYEGGTRVVAVANWPGHIRPGSTVDAMIHVVDMFPTLAALAGSSRDKGKPLDGVDVWKSISEGAPSPWHCANAPTNSPRPPSSRCSCRRNSTRCANGCTCRQRFRVRSFNSSRIESL